MKKTIQVLNKLVREKFDRAEFLTILDRFGLRKTFEEWKLQ